MNDMRKIMKSFLSILFISLFLVNAQSFADNSDIRFLEKKEIEDGYGLVKRMCIGGYEFVVLCKNSSNRCKLGTHSHYQMSQIITESGGGKRC